MSLRVNNPKFQGKKLSRTQSGRNNYFAQKEKNCVIPKIFTNFAMCNKNQAPRQI